MDVRDQKILSALMENAWLTYAELGQHVNLSPSAVQRRVKKLQSNGIIEGAYVRVADVATGRPVRLYVQLELQEETAASVEAFILGIANEPDLVEAFYTAGSSDVVLIMQTSSMSAYAAFVEKKLNSNPIVRRYSTLTVLRRLL